MTSPSIIQQPLLELEGVACRHHSPPRVPLEEDSERLLQAFRQARLESGGTLASVSREVWQLRSIVRVGCHMHGATTLATLVKNPSGLAAALSHPPTEIARSTARARVVAALRFIQTMGPQLGLDSPVLVDEVIRHLPTRPTAGWHRTGMLQVGTQARRRPRGPTLYPEDLGRLVDAAAATPGERGARDRALVALHCYSGLHPGEIVALRWEDMASAILAPGRSTIQIRVIRSGVSVVQPLPTAASVPLRAWARSAQAAGSELTGHVFVRTLRSGKPLSYRTAREVVRTSCVRAGLPSIESHNLRSACAYWLRSQGLSHHEIAKVLCVTRVRTIDRMLAFHVRLDALRQVRNGLGEW
jgi:integrase